MVHATYWCDPDSSMHSQYGYTNKRYWLQQEVIRITKNPARCAEIRNREEPGKTHEIALFVDSVKPRNAK